MPPLPIKLVPGILHIFINSQYIMQEKRNMERFEINLSVQIKNKGVVIEGLQTMDISSQGVFILTNNPLAHGEEIDVKVLIPVIDDSIKHNDRQSLIHASGTVVRVAETGMAVQFKNNIMINTVINQTEH